MNVGGWSHVAWSWCRLPAALLTAVALVTTVSLTSHGGALSPARANVATAAEATVERITGADRFDVAVNVSQRAFPDGATTVVVANGLTFPDALSGAPVAAALDGPVLVTMPAALPSPVASEIRRLNPDRILILGGVNSVTPAVENTLRTLAPQVERVAGADRYAVSRELALRFLPDASTVFIATGRGFPDALAGAGVAASLGSPVLLIDGLGSGLDEATRATLLSLEAERIVILGGPATVLPQLESELATLAPAVERVGGADRFAVAVGISERFISSSTTALFATGLTFPDALTGAALAASGYPMYLTPFPCPTAATLSDALERLEVASVIILGGPRSVSPDAELMQGCAARATERDAAEAALERGIAEVDAAHAGVYSVSVRELGGLRRSVSVGGDVMQEPASVMKLFVAYAVLDRIDRGLLSDSSPSARSGLPVSTCLRVIIHVSDNYCHWDLVETVGAQAINDQLWAEGYRHTAYQGYHPGTGQYVASKKTSTDDVALLLERLETGELLSVESSARLIELMETQLWRHRIPAGLPPDVAIANKTGFLWVTQSGYLHADVAIVDAPTGRYVVSIIGRGNATANGVRDMGRRVWEHLVGAVPVTADYSGANMVTTAAVNFRSGASTTSPVIAVIPAGTMVSADAGVRQWYTVNYAGTYGYVHSDYLRNRFDYPRR